MNTSVHRIIHSAALAGVFLSLLFSACSSGRKVTDGADDAESKAPPDFSRFETFDQTPYRDDAVQFTDSVRHEAPEALLRGHADAGIIQIVPGYRIQVFSSLDRNEAVIMEEEIRKWWNRYSAEQKAEASVPESIEVYNMFRQPYYRVRVGDFPTREAAERLLAFMRGRFLRALIVPDQVTIRR